MQNLRRNRAAVNRTDIPDLLRRRAAKQRRIQHREIIAAVLRVLFDPPLILPDHVLRTVRFLWYSVEKHGESLSVQSLFSQVYHTVHRLSNHIKTTVLFFMLSGLNVPLLPVSSVIRSLTVQNTVYHRFT